jgi:hypothetical protein
MGFFSAAIPLLKRELPKKSKIPSILLRDLSAKQSWLPGWQIS